MAGAPPCGCAAAAANCPLRADWADDERMGFLFAPFGEDDNEEAVAFWRGAVAHVGAAAGLAGAQSWLTATPAELEARFERDGVAPLCLRRALAAMAGDGYVCQAGDVAPAGGGLSRRVVRALVVRPARWAWSYVSAPDPLSGGRAELVYRPLLAGAAALLAQFCATRPAGERVVPVDSDEALLALCRAAAAWPGARAADERAALAGAASGRDCAALRAQLLTDGAAAEGGGAFKVDGGERVSDADVALLRLRASERALQTQLGALTDKAAGVKAEALALKRKKNTQGALLAMRRLKRLAGAEERFRGSLANVHAALDSLESMHGDAAVLQAYADAAGALRATREALGLTPEAVDDAQEALAAEMDAQDEIATAIATMGGMETTPEEDESLLLELASLEGSPALGVEPAGVAAAAAAAGAAAAAAGAAAAAPVSAAPAVEAEADADALAAELERLSLELPVAPVGAPVVAPPVAPAAQAEPQPEPHAA